MSEDARIDEVDRGILAALEGDARLSYARIGEMVGLSKTPCWKRVQALEASGAIRGYHADVDPAALGYGTSAFVRIRVQFDRHGAFEDAVRRHPLVIAAHATIGDFDYQLAVIARDIPALDRFLRSELWQMPGVDRFVTTLAMREIKSASGIAGSR